MKRTLTLTGAGLAAAGLALALVPALPAAAADPVPCARMGGTVTILNTPTPTCTMLYTSGKASILLPANAPKEQSMLLVKTCDLSHGPHVTVAKQS